MNDGHVIRLVFENTENGDAIVQQLTFNGNDVIGAPVAHEELLARLRALLRADVCDLHHRVIDCGGLQIDTIARTVTFGLIPIELRRLEYELLVHLARDPQRVYTKHELLRDVWGFRSQGCTRTVDSHASRLRRKLALAGAEGYVANVRGVGFRLAPGARLRVIPGGLAA